jgi:hypothetical protein
MTTNNAFLPDWCSDPLVYYDEWIARLFRESTDWQDETIRTAKVPALSSDLPLEAAAQLAAHALESMPHGFSRFGDLSVANGVRDLVEERCMYDISSAFISKETRERVLSNAPNMIRLLAARTTNTLRADDDVRDPCASQLFMVWDCPIGWRIEQFDSKLAQKLVLEQIQSNHLPSIKSGLHGIGHRDRSVQALFDWNAEVTRHVLSRDLPQRLKAYAVRALARDVQ